MSNTYPSKDTPIDELRISFEGDNWSYPGHLVSLLRKEGKTFDDISIDDLLPILEGWYPFRNAKIVSLFDSTGKTKILMDRSKEQGISNAVASEVPETKEYYHYLKLPAYPGKLFKIRCEEVVDGFGLADMLIPSSEDFNKQYREFTSRSPKINSDKKNS